MHTSAAATAENITKITEKYLSETSNLPVLVRTPKMIYNYLGLTLTEAQNYVIEKDSPAYRLGIFNDGYLGSSSDLGTYTDREKDIAFLKTKRSICRTAAKSLLRQALCTISRSAPPRCSK